MSPLHSIDFCPICGGGLCGIRICGVDEEGASDRFARTGSDAPHGMVVCDECDAIWLEPDLTTAHQYPDVEDARCPICGLSLWGNNSRWATSEDVAALGWEFAVNPDLDAASDEEIA